MIERTILVFNEFSEGIKFICLTGDYSKLDGVYINEYVEDDYVLHLQDQLSDIQSRGCLDARESFPEDFYIPGTTKVIVCGFIP